MELIDRLSEQEKAATPGPWESQATEEAVPAGLIYGPDGLPQDGGSVVKLYKATDPAGRSFRDSSVTWTVGEVTRHRKSKKMVANEAATYLSVSSEPADCTGFVWPCRLFEVVAVGETMTGLDYPNKVAGLAFRVVRELPAWQAFGPNGQAIAALVERCKRLTPDEARKLAAAWAAARAAARAARDAARALLVRDKIAPKQFDILTKPWRDAGLELEGQS